MSAPRPRRPYALAVLVAGLAMAGTVGWWQREQNLHVERARFDALTGRAAEQVLNRMRGYEKGLRGARGAVIAAGKEALTRERFREYSDSRDLDREFPGTRGFGFIRRVPAAHEAAFLAEARRDGAPHFAIRQLQTHGGDRYVIQYIEPVALNQEAVGLDIASEPNRLAAAETATRTGRPTLTAPITLVQASGKHLRSMLLLLPIYRQDQLPPSVSAREASVFGWAYMPLVIDEALADFDYADEEFALALSDTQAGGAGEPFFSSPGWAGAPPGALRRQLALPMYGREWHLDVRALPGFRERLNLRDPGALAAGLAGAAVLLAGLVQVWLLAGQRQQTVRLQQSRMAAMVDSSHDAIVGVTVDGRVTDWNAAAERIFGYTAAEALGRSLQELVVPPDSQAQAAEVLVRAARGEEVPRFDAVRRRRDGSLLDVSVSISAIRMPGLGIVGVATTVRDISLHKAAEAKILHLNATLEQQVQQRTAEVRALAARERAILLSAASAVIACDTEGRVTLFNPAAEAMLRYPAQEVIGRLFIEQFHDPVELDARAEALSAGLGRPVSRREALLARASPGTSDRGEWTYVRRDGSRLPVLLNVAELRDDAGHVLGSIAIAADLSERKRLERELVALNEALTERSRQAESATRAKSAFLANMSHEIRTPMNAIIGLTQFLLRDSRDPALRERLQLVSEASHHLLSIINNVLDLSKIEVGKLELEQADFELEEVLTRTLALVRGAAREKGLELVLDLDHLPTRLVGDPTRLGQAVLNLLGNAVKFTHAGSVTLRGVCCEQDEAQVLLRFEVHDTGIGMAPGVIDKVFHAFEQGDNSTTRRYGGTGLGLTITRELVQLMGGETGASSRQGEGSTFWFTARFQRAAAEQVGEALAPSLQGRPVLLLEPLPPAREALASLLRRFGLQPAAAHEAAEVPAQAQAARAAGRPYTVVVLAAELPHDEDAVALARRLLAEAGDAAMRCLLVTRRNVADLAPGLAGEERIRVLEKPVAPATLRLHLEELLGGRPRAQAGAGSEAASLAAAERNRPFEGTRVLLAEDHPVNQLVAMEQLGSLGMAIDLAETGVEAVEQARSRRYDLILMDLHMPEMDGLKAARAIRGLPEHAATPILAMTASAFGEDRDACLAAGMNDHIPKPVETDVLVRTLGRWLRPLH
ncbi:CHASE domain-containing protein [Eleftheria terrae]|uniref:CHASE domain-containing protein n=1 Tax=Eleftheria terrae TaxID=1597781 RepID=UPI00263B799D|nr:CHASE domain-containing protein [Eleftheria terrae]WKB53453.1 CHASE domain-containing protein [Eleftheria terrae]